MPHAGCRRILTLYRKGGTVYHSMDRAWFWMTFMGVFWVALIGIAVYLAVRLGRRPPRGKAS
jgi:hypothetical protein